MMANLKGTRTEANLMATFAGESQARNKYTFYASKAKKDGYVQIAQLFEETANNEKEHAKIWFKRALTRLLTCLKQWGKLKKSMRSVISSCWPTWKAAWFSLKKGIRSGNAPTAGISISASRPRSSARFVRIRKLTSRFSPRIIKGRPASDMGN